MQKNNEVNRSAQSRVRIEFGESVFGAIINALLWRQDYRARRRNSHVKLNAGAAC
jgi:hypothetical protein